MKIILSLTGLYIIKVLGIRPTRRDDQDILAAFRLQSSACPAITTYVKSTVISSNDDLSAL